jgi:hypothetical protein
VERFAIRAPSLDYLLDPYSAEALEKRPLTDDARERILDAWIDTREERPEALTIVVPSELREPGLGEKLESAVRADLVETSLETAKLRIYSRAQLRQAQIAFVFLVGCLFASNMIDRYYGDQGLVDSVAQGLVVLGWVAMWGPADRFFRAVFKRLSHKRYRELAAVPIDVTWD